MWNITVLRSAENLLNLFECSGTEYNFRCRHDDSQQIHWNPGNGRIFEVAVKNQTACIKKWERNEYGDGRKHESNNFLLILVFYLITQRIIIFPVLLYTWEISFLSWRVEYMLNIFGNWVLREILRPEKGGARKRMEESTRWGASWFVLLIRHY